MEKDRERAPRGAKRTRKKVCMFCADRVEKIDYKEVPALTIRESLLPLLSAQDILLLSPTFPTDSVRNKICSYGRNRFAVPVFLFQAQLNAWD